MAICSKRGRPRAVADYSAKDLALPLYFEFHEACDTLSYREMLALSRVCKCDLTTVYRWKNHRTRPQDFNTMLQIIEWVKAGKPIKLETQAEIANKSFML